MRSLAIHKHLRGAAWFSGRQPITFDAFLRLSWCCCCFYYRLRLK